MKAVSRGCANGVVATVVLAVVAFSTNRALAQDPLEIFGAEAEFAGSTSAELRFFPESPQFTDQDDRKLELSVAIEPEFRLFWDRERLTFIPFFRYDPADHEGRTHGDIRELSLYVERDDWDVTAGIGKVFWGVAESRHLVDIINQADLVENSDEEDKLGQPMVNLNLLRDWGTLGVFVLPGFRERTFPGDEARLRGPLPVDTDRPIYESAAEEHHVDAALRYKQVIGDFDLGLSYFHGTSREPELVQSIGSDGRPVLRPRYEIIDQVGLDVQATMDAWLWKLEAIHRSGAGDPFAAAVGGFEYTLFGVSDSAADLGLLAEYHYDGRGDDAPATIFDNDIFLGTRLALNDTDATEFLAGVIVDQREGEVLALLEAERRITERWFAEVEARFFFNADRGTSAVQDDGHVLLRISRYF
ncbi:hypothetical protein EOI86_03330 [Hwanghaeella grinnelliae]|uniref:Porin n=1 Tax=Hwanghaeella grinnelliae TaxID=2500179 RepID=A0A3S2VR77_9PROT|nr:hypothetical protein EOI86_03330 [Hwanghaeella grinnelliae]